jgi:SnoaL-like domain
VDRNIFTAWIERYEAAWRTPGTSVLDDLFAEDATYSPAPFEEVITGRPAIADFWEAEREGPDEVFTLSTGVVAVEGDTGVARLEVTYGDPPARYYRDLWIVTLGPDGRCTAFEEWPFFPGQGRVAP